MLLLALIAVPVVVGTAAFFLGKRRITIIELAIQLAIVLGLIVGGYYLFRWAGIQDYEVWNGRIAAKHSGSSTCCHSYDCNCRQECTGSGENESCSQVCDTCYEHDHDFYFTAVSTNNEEVYSNSCVVSGIPYDWEQIRIGEPTAWEHRFTNYILADPDELVPRDVDVQQFRDKIPRYPKTSGWNAQRFLFVDISVEDALQLDIALDELNADLGAAHQVNIVIVVARQTSPDYFRALRATWLGGKKNDVVLVVGAPEFPKIQWARVMAWNRAKGAEDEFKLGLAQRVEALGEFNGTKILEIVRDAVVTGYERRPFSELEYLMARARPPGWAVITLFSIGLALSALLSWLFWRNRHRMKGRAPHEVVRDFARRYLFRTTPRT